MNLKHGKPFRSKWFMAVLAIVPALTVFTGIGASPADAYKSSDADIAIRAFNQYFWNPETKHFRADSQQSDSYQSFWVEAELWEMVMDSYLHTSDRTLKQQLRQQIDDIFTGAVAKYGEDWTNNPFNDDILWWAMASARAYQITGEPKYLDKAKYYFDFVYDTQWDEEFGGGLWWLNSEHVTKNACINFPAAEAAVFLYEISGDQHYLDAASRIFRWGKTMLTDGKGKVFDRIEPVRGGVPDATHYNQGTFIGAAVGLYRSTGDSVYLEDAVKAAQFVKEHQTDENRLLNYEGPNGDLKGGKTILIRNLAYLLTSLDGKKAASGYKQFSRELDEWLAYNTEMAWSHRNEDGIVDGNWIGRRQSGTYDSWTASSAVQALAVLKPRSMPLSYQTRDAYQKIEAEKYNDGKGFILEGSAEGTMQLGGIQSGHFAAYKQVDFGKLGAKGFIARVASGTAGGRIEIRLDALNGPVVGTVNVEDTGGWEHFMDAVSVLKDHQGHPATVTGVHDVYLVFEETTDSYLFNLNWFKFTRDDPTRTDAFAKLQAEDFDDSFGLDRNMEHGYIEGISDGAHALYRGIDFADGASGVTVYVSSGSQGGTIEVRLDSPQGPVVSEIPVPAMGDWNRWMNMMSIVDDTLATGTHDVYLTFKGTNGADFPCNLDWFNFTTVKGKVMDAYSKIEAESYTSAVELGTETGGGHTYLAGLYGPNQPYAMYNYIDFGSGSPEQFHVHAASDTAGGTLEVRIDGVNGPVISTVQVTGTGGWQKFQVFSSEITTRVTGKHLIFLVFKGSDWLYNIDKFTFGDPEVFTAPAPEPEPVIDHIPPGEVENVRVVQAGQSMRLYWDGPYDLDGQKVLISLFQNKKQVGHTLEVSRGVQTVVLPKIPAAKSYSITIQSVDVSGNRSKGYTFRLKDHLRG